MFVFCMPKVMILLFGVVKEAKYTYVNLHIRILYIYIIYPYVYTVYPDDITLEEPLAICSFPLFQAWWRPLV